MNKISKLLLGSVLGFSSMASSAVDIKSGAYTIRRSDQSLDNEFAGFSIGRVYNSTVGYDGLFGFGWCSSFETTLKVVAKGQIAVVECGAGQVKVYNSSDFSEKNTAAAVDLLAEAMQKAGQSMTPALRDEMLKSRYKRTKMLSKFKVNIEVSKTPYSIVPFSKDEQITYNKKQFILKTANGLTQTFDESGKLILQKHARGDSIKLSYGANGALNSITSQRGQSLIFKMDDTGHITEMRGLSEATRYTYKDGMLMKVSQKSGDENYTYADYLMTAVERGGKKTEIKYNPTTRFVSRLQDKDCTDDYNYVIDKATLKFKAEFKSTCKGAAPKTVTYEFEYQKANDGTIFQKRMVATDASGGKTSAEYIAEGKPSKIVQKGREFKYEYDSESRVTGKETDSHRLEYTYFASGKVSNVRVLPKSKGGAGGPIQYNYDKDMKLASVNINNETIQYSYDSKGRLTKMQTKKGGPSFTIQTDGLTGHVKRIVAQGYGYFEMKYSSSGQLLKSEWKGDAEKGLAMLNSYEALRTPYDQSIEIGVPL